jgi:hypothetical protein
MPTASHQAAADQPATPAIADQVATGQLPQTIAAATQALANPALAADERMALLAPHFDCHLMCMELEQAGADVQAMQTLARRPADVPRQAQSRVCESRLQWRVGNAQAILAAAQAALKAAQRNERPALVAHSLAALGNAQAHMGDLKPQGHAMFDQAGVVGALGRAA